LLGKRKKNSEKIQIARFPLFIVLGLGMQLFSACLPQVTPEPSPTATLILSSETPTPTVIWFPATPTYTPYPTLELLPTEDLSPAVGELILEDDFSDPDVWLLSETTAGSVALGSNQLTIVINATDTFLSSVRDGWLLTDFYLEITASPSMCRQLDEYGVLLRVSSTMDFYRFSLSCNGQMRLDRVYRGAASSPQPWMMSGAVPPGAPSSSTLGVWVSGSEMRFFVNDRYQFTVNDSYLTSGGVGVFARSTVDWPTTINFSDLKIYSIFQPGE